MSLFVDTSVWSLAWRRDGSAREPAVLHLADALAQGRDVLTTGLVLQELLQGFAGPKARRSILDRFRHLPMLTPTREDHVRAAELRNRCRRKGVQVGTIDALIAQLCVHHELKLLTTDHDFFRLARIVPIQLAKP
ncbi:MAG: PIN domain-containing protein [Deltaproteobacteria bacterium]|jgi:predicted nucleic acid-binding protein|nr:PIN domain-containing protein [Deltaproteobacteria bacterium]MBW2533077.1 PIN domain-containing protein [Deltaproteobacteria bacterium]